METIGKAALTVIAGGMDSSTPATKQQLPKPAIRLPQTVDEAKALKVWAEAQCDRPEPAAPLQITNHLKFLAATLPSKNLDDTTGKMRFAVYSSILGDFSNEALAYMARRACAELDWFPTPRQCLDILRDYREPATDRDKALMLCHRFWQGRFEDFIAALKADTATDDDVAAVPETWRKIAMEQGYLRWIADDQVYAIRRKVLSA
ncbi:MAG: hypothetical protein A3H25_02875 [Sphingomonadales bacterium RIFCSPLOWO2_12_FULL_63_15]|nr:MAG: hypothetical protein A3H25_02875 [Sphingomonadales bacterium RIFCSPLOWO2_12_FULL_63_15]